MNTKAGYTVDGLLHGIERCKLNIGVLEQAISREQGTIADYKIMISDIKNAEAKKAEAEANVHVEVVRDDTD